MTLQEFIDTLPQDKQFKLAVKLTKLTLPVWDSYAENNQLAYRDSVVGMTHSVDRNLLNNTIMAIEDRLNSNKSMNALLALHTKFDDPIISLQDTDWELPKAVLLIFYSVFNLLEACLGKTKTNFGDLTVYVSINQAIDALEVSKVVSTEDIRQIISSV